MLHMGYTREIGDFFYEDTEDPNIVQFVFPFVLETKYKDGKVYDINGRKIEECDYVRTDELGWCGFAFYNNFKTLDYTLAIEGSGGFSVDPYNIEWLGSPKENYWVDNKAREQCFKYESDFMKKKKIIN